MSYTKTELANALIAQINALFPTSYAAARIGSLTGLGFVYANASESSNAKFGILDNDPAFMKFIFHIDVRGRTEIEILTSNCHRNGVKFRKISNDDGLLAVSKLVKWFEKNREAILAVGI